jgi:hypothetical protein
LNELRIGGVSPKTKAILQNCNASIGDKAIKLLVKISLLVKRKQMWVLILYHRFSTVDEVEKENTARLDKLPGTLHVSDASDCGSDYLFKQCTWPKQLNLKKNARVVLLMNLDDDLVNGSTGFVSDFPDNAPYITVEFDNGRRCNIGLKMWTFTQNGIVFLYCIAL